MKNCIVLPGKTYARPWTNGTGGDKASGAICPIGSVASEGYGIAQGAIANGASGVVFTEGVFEVGKPTGTAYNPGDLCEYNSGNDEVDLVDATNGGAAGFSVWEAAASAATTVKVQILPPGSFLEGTG